LLEVRNPVTQEDDSSVDVPAESGENFELKNVEGVDFEVDAVGDLVLYVSDAVLVDEETGEEYVYQRVPAQRRMKFQPVEGDE